MLASTKKPALLLVSVLLGTLLACSSQDQTGPDCADGRCDSRGDHMIEFLELHNYQEDPGTGQIEFHLLAAPSNAAFGSLEDGDLLAAELWLVDGDANPDFKIHAELEYDADALGGFISDAIDASGFSPWREMHVRLTGSLSDGTAVSETFAFDAGELRGRRVDDVADVRLPISAASLVAVQSGPEEFTFSMHAEVDDALFGVPEDNEELIVEFFLVDGDANPDFKITDTLFYEADNVGAYVTEQIDATAFVPFRVMHARITGFIGSQAVDQTFAFIDGSTEGELVASPKRVAKLRMFGYESSAGESESFQLVAFPESDAFFAVDMQGSITAELSLLDGDANPDFKITAEMPWDGLTEGWESATIDSSAFLPWRVMQVRLSGTLANGEQLDEVFVFDGANSDAERR